MKKGLYLIFRCRYCGKVYEEKCGDRTLCLKTSIGVKSHSLVSTHKCAEKGVYGCADLIGCRDYDERSTAEK